MRSTAALTANPCPPRQRRDGRLTHTRQGLENARQPGFVDIDLHHDPAAGFEHRREQQHKVFDALSLERLFQGMGAGKEAGRRAHHLVDHLQAIGLQGRSGGGVVDDQIGILGWQHLGGSVGAQKAGLEPATLDPAPGQTLILRSDDQSRTRLDASRQQVARHRRHQSHGVEAGIEQLHQVPIELGYPVLAGEAKVS
mgnify:CR=1 FL=1